MVIDCQVSNRAADTSLSRHLGTNKWPETPSLARGILG
jgi:hypothetical protein